MYDLDEARLYFSARVKLSLRATHDCPTAQCPQNGDCLLLLHIDSQCRPYCSPTIATEKDPGSGAQMLRFLNKNISRKLQLHFYQHLPNPTQCSLTHANRKQKNLPWPSVMSSALWQPLYVKLCWKALKKNWILEDPIKGKVVRVSNWYAKHHSTCN